MKKNIILFLSICLILTGCGEKKVNNDDNTNNQNIEVNEAIDNINKQEENSEQSKNDEIKDNSIDENNKDENNSNNTVTSNKSEKPSCIPKKFKNKYSYVYKTKDECLKEGNNAFFEVSDNIDSEIFTYDCEQIVDDCGTTWYGVYFNRWSNTSEEVYKVYY